MTRNKEVIILLTQRGKKCQQPNDLEWAHKEGWKEARATSCKKEKDFVTFPMASRYQMLAGNKYLKRQKRRFEGFDENMGC